MLEESLTSGGTEPLNSLEYVLSNKCQNDRLLGLLLGIILGKT